MLDLKCHFRQVTLTAKKDSRMEECHNPQACHQGTIWGAATHTHWFPLHPLASGPQPAASAHHGTLPPAPHGAYSSILSSTLSLPLSKDAFESALSSSLVLVEQWPTAGNCSCRCHCPLCFTALDNPQLLLFPEEQQHSTS